MTFFEGIVIFFILYFVFSGFKSGFIRTAGAFVGFLVGVFFASHYYEPISQAWLWLFFGNVLLAKVVTFVLLYVLIDKLFKLAVYILDRAFNLLRFIPFTKLINRLAGALFGFLEGSLLVGFTLYLFVRFPVSTTVLAAIERSQLAKQLIKFADILAPLLPDAVETMKSLI